LDGAGGKADQTQAAQLLKQFATLQVQEMIARLRQKQAQDRVAAAKRTAQDFANEAKKAQTFSQSLSKDADFLEGAVDSFISMARQLTDIVAEDVFVARRSLEIYELDDASDVRFSYGYLHPDDDHSLVPLQRGYPMPAERCRARTGYLSSHGTTTSTSSTPPKPAGSTWCTLRFRYPLPTRSFWLIFLPGTACSSRSTSTQHLLPFLN
jgi:hypothetical protein